MCGIAGFSLEPDGIGIDPTDLARVLLAGLCERGKDATGYAWQRSSGPVELYKESRRVVHVFDRVAVPHEARTVAVHVREFTKGTPALNENNHPIRWGDVVGVHNGSITNDDALFEQYGERRSSPTISVDSEAIMMLASILGDLGAALAQVRGSAAVALMRDDRPGHLELARRTRRPLVLAKAPGIVLFASTREPLELVARAARLRLSYEDVGEGTVIEIARGREIARRRFDVDLRYPGTPAPVYPVAAEKRTLVLLALAALGT
jgi:glucosamine 6-phosphate synthetase-like amidotransferase/phosphosugar isomerase protein